jgi:hypothetical protein
MRFYYNECYFISALYLSEKTQNFTPPWGCPDFDAKKEALKSSKRELDGASM